MALREVFARLGFEFDDAKLKKADQGVDQLGSRLRDVASVLAGGAIARGFLSLAQKLDVFDDLAAQTQVATDQLQLLTYAAETNGSSTEEMIGALTRLQASLGRATEATSPQIEALQALGVSLNDASGNARSLDQLLPEIVAGFGGLENETQRALAASDLFGRSGVKLLPVLRQGEAGMAALRVEFERFGGPISDDTLKAAGLFRDGIARMNTAWLKLGATVAEHAFPVLTRVFERVAEGAARFAKFTEGTTLAKSATVALALAMTALLMPALKALLLPGFKFAAIFLAIDELVAFLDGQRTVIGDILDSWFGAGTADAVRDWLDGVVGSFKDFFGLIFDETRAAKLRAQPELMTWFDRFLDTIRLLPAAVRNAGALMATGWDSATAQLALSWESLVLGMIDTWNGFVEKLSLPDFVTGALKIDRTDRANQQRGAQEAADRADREHRRLGAGIVADRFSPAAAAAPAIPATIDGVNLRTGPLRIGTGEFSMVQNLTVNLPAGTSASDARAVARAVAQRTKDANRTAAQALQQRAGGN